MSDHLQSDPVLEPSPRAARRPAVAVPEPAEVHLTDYLKVLSRRRWPALTAFLAVMVAVVVFTFTATPIYRARVQLLIENENPNVVSFKEVIEQEKTTNDYYQTQYRMLQSRSLARRVLDRLNVWSVFTPPVEKSGGLRQTVATAVAPVTSMFQSSRAVEPPAADETKQQSSALDGFLANLTVSPVRNSRLVELEYASPNAELAASVANGIAHAYIEQNLEFKFTSSKEASDWLGQRLGEQRKKVEDSESALQQYRERNDAVSLEERQNIVVQKLADLSTAVTRAKTERLQKEAAYNQIRSVEGSRAALDTIPAILSNQFVQQQKTQLAELQRQQAQVSEKLGPRHPDMVRLRLAIEAADARIQGEIAKVVQSQKNDYDTSLAQEQSLARALEQQKQDALAFNRKGIEYGSLQRDAASNRQIFDSLLQRTKETGISGELKTSNIRIVDLAEVPRSPASPNRLMNLAVGLVAACLFACAFVFFFEYVDDRIKAPGEIKAHLGVPFLGMVPVVADSSDGSSPLLHRGVQPGFGEALRTLRTNVLFSSTEDGGQTLAVTSSGPGEGKTVVASNLALALAQTGQRVLLIDADMRRPRVHEVLQQRQEPGLSNVLTGDSKYNDSVLAIENTGLSVLTAGHMPPNPAELLGSKRFEDLLIMLKARFDWVVIDTPPVMAVTDAPIITHITDGVLFVVGSEMTSRGVAQTAIEQLVNANARIVGAVLNRVDLDNNGYYYSQYYRREYGHYYVKSA